MTGTLREAWAAGRPTLGAWIGVPSPVVAEAAARCGFDYVCADLQHGALDDSAPVGLFQATLLGGSRPIVRVPWLEPGVVGRMLDAGAEGVVVPMVNSADEATAVVRAVRYPPDGARSYGPMVGGLRAPVVPAAANAAVAAIPMIETVTALDHLDDILAVPGVDAVYVGPADLSISLGLAPGNNDGEPSFREALAAIVAGCRRHGVVPGIHATGALTSRRLEQGVLMVTVANDLPVLRAALSSELALARSDVTAVDGPGVY